MLQQEHASIGVVDHRVTRITGNCQDQRSIRSERIALQTFFAIQGIVAGAGGM
jgi:hypothetical protein